MTAPASPRVAEELVESTFMALVMPEPNGGCWLWLGGLNKERGYGKFSAPTGRVMAHRWAYEHFVGPIPDGLQIDHACRVRHCVNPEHLRPVTARENTLIGDGRTARNFLKTHCLHGHEFTPENTYLKTTLGHEGQRHCKTCVRKRHKESRARIRRTRAMMVKP